MTQHRLIRLAPPTASERIRALRDVEARRKAEAEAIEAQRQRAAIRRSVERG